MARSSVQGAGSPGIEARIASPGWRAELAFRFKEALISGSWLKPGRGLHFCLALFAFCLLPASGHATQPKSSLVKPLAHQSLLLDAVYAGESIVAVGERGHVLLSEDGGGSWRQVPVPTRVMLTAVSFHDADLGVAVGHDATVLRTADGGRTWQRVYFEPEEERPFLDVYFHDARNVTAIGAYGYFLESRDGGESWTPRELTAVDPGGVAEPDDAGETYPEDFHFNRLAVSDQGRWYMAAEAGNIYRSDDRGTTWRRLPSPYEGSFLGLLALAGEQLLVYGLQGVLFYSEDAGGTWRPVETGTRATLTSAGVLQDGRLLVAGYSGSVVIADRDLADIRLVQLEQRMGISAMLQLESGDLLLFGTGGVMRLPLNTLRK